jgi:hypothetical protein
MGRTKGKRLVVLVFSVLLLSVTQCARKTNDLPKDLLGIYIGMNREDAQKRLEEIAVFESKTRKTGHLWKLKNDSHFSHLAIDYNKENKIRFVTAFVDAATAKERIRFAEVGDLTTAKAEISEPHYRYIWEIPAEGDKPDCVVNIYGDNPEFVTMYTLADKIQSDKLRNQ